MREILPVFANAPTVDMAEALSEPHVRADDYLRMWVDGEALSGDLDTEASAVVYKADSQRLALGLSLNDNLAPFENALSLINNYQSTIGEVQQWLCAREWTVQQQICMRGLSGQTRRVAIREGLRSIASIMLLSSEETRQRSAVITVPKAIITDVFDKINTSHDDKDLRSVLAAAEEMGKELFDLPEGETAQHMALGMLIGSIILPEPSIVGGSASRASHAYTQSMLDKIAARM